MDSLINKLNELRLLIKRINPIIIVITEILPKKSWALVSLEFDLDG